MPDSEVPNSTEDLLTGKRNDFWQLWRRRTFLILALLLLLIPLYGTFEPLFEFILFAVSLAALTYPIFYQPIERFGRKLLPRAQARRRSELCAVVATILLLVVLLSPFFLLLFQVSGNIKDITQTITMTFQKLPLVLWCLIQ